MKDRQPHPVFSIGHGKSTLGNPNAREIITIPREWTSYEFTSCFGFDDSHRILELIPHMLEYTLTGKPGINRSTDYRLDVPNECPDLATLVKSIGHKFLSLSTLHSFKRVKESLSHTSDLESKAMTIAGKAFEGKVDRGGHPYFGHLYRVAESVHGEDGKTVAWLHDLLEDCPEWTEEKLREEFPFHIVDAVVAITKKDGQRYKDFIEQVCTNELAMQVKLADLRDNMDITRLSELTDNDLQRLKKYHAAHKLVDERIDQYLRNMLKA